MSSPIKLGVTLESFGLAVDPWAIPFDISKNPQNEESLIPFYLTPHQRAAAYSPLGLCGQGVFREIIKDHEAAVAARGLSSWAISSAVAASPPSYVAFAEHVVDGGREAMCSVIAVILAKWRAQGLFSPALDKWRNELADVFGYDDTNNGEQGEVKALFSIERAAMFLFGFAHHVVCVVGYTGVGDKMKVWVQERSATCKVDPNMLSPMVAGGIIAGSTPFDTMLEECWEEAKLETNVIRPLLRKTGSLRIAASKKGFTKFTVMHTFECQLPDDIVPQLHDHAAASYELKSIPNVITSLEKREFAPFLGMVMVDFLLVHDAITTGDETDLAKFRERSNRVFPVSGGNWSG